ncbi:hypothetical protein [Nostoc sp.]|uniref:hypothetical protein n=1 Tax=Nostoc sp. TaxID=1180 RepID=UPI002FFB6AC7
MRRVYVDENTTTLHVGVICNGSCANAKVKLIAIGSLDGKIGDHSTKTSASLKNSVQIYRIIELPNRNETVAPSGISTLCGSKEQPLQLSQAVFVSVLYHCCLMSNLLHI